MTIQQAIDLFDKQQYQEAFAAFVDVYQQSGDGQEKANILQILEEAYYAPNAEELRGNYEKNAALLKKYPYVWEKTFRKFEDLSIQIFPVSDEAYYGFDRENGCFFGEYDARSKARMRYFFENLDKPLQVEDEDNFYNLTFLNDNVRTSEDFAGDNHIYLLYSSQEVLERLMLACDLETVLQQQKFVFLIGEENWKRYPINFRKRFGIDYSKMKPAPIRIEEIKRICFFYKKSHCGTLLTSRSLGSVSGIQALFAAYFNEYSTIDGKKLTDSEEFKTAMSDIYHCYTVEQLESIVHSDRYDLKLDVYNEDQIFKAAVSSKNVVNYGGADDYLSWLKRQKRAGERFTIRELFCAYFLWQYDKRALNPRIIPVLLFDPHMVDPRIYSSLVLSFPYYTCLTSVRDPVMVSAREYNTGMIGLNKFSTQYRFGSDYVFTQFLHPELQTCYFGFRFEDMKLKPEVVFRAICKHLNVPYEPQMLEADAPWPDMAGGGTVTRGFDTAPLYRDNSAFFSEFDEIRLRIFYDPILRHYNYKTFPFEEHPIPDEIVRELFKIPFRFEHINNKRFLHAPPKEVLHQWIQEVLQGAWKKKAVMPKMLPLEEDDPRSNSET